MSPGWIISQLVLQSNLNNNNKKIKKLREKTLLSY